MRYITIGTAGHIDHGKSTLVRALTGIDPDRLQEEKARGITIDLGFAHVVRDQVMLAFVDVPGHERFVKNMLAGATGVDVVLLVIGANESVMPQTREHFDICRLLRVRRGVVALTKTDLVDADTVDLVKLEVRDLVAGSFLESAPIVAVSATEGRGLDALLEALLATASNLPGRRPDGVFRLPIDRAFTVRGFGTVVTGTVASGGAAPDDVLELLPGGAVVKVRTVQGHGSTLVRVATGQRAAVNVSGVDLSDVSRGDCLVTRGSFVPTRRLDASLELLRTARALPQGSRVRFHHGTGETLGRVSVSSARSAASAQPLPDAAAIPPGAQAHVRIRLEKVIVATRGDRFVLRAYSPPVTIAGGMVLDPHPPRTAIRTAAGRDRFEALTPRPDRDQEASEEIDRVVRRWVDEGGPRGLPRAALVWRAGLAPGAADAVVQRLCGSGTIAAVGDGLVAVKVLDALAEGLLAMIGDYHRSEPLSEGMPREEARERLFARAHAAAFDAVLQRLVSAGALVARDRVALAAHKVALPADDEQALGRLATALGEAGLRPPDSATLAADLGLPPSTVERALMLLQRRKVLMRIDTLWFHVDALDRLKSEIRDLKQGGGQVRVDVAAFKDRYGVTRKFAIPLLEYLDRERVTRRIGDARVVL